jgi:hypothetical protein
LSAELEYMSVNFIKAMRQYEELRNPPQQAMAPQRKLTFGIYSSVLHSADVAQPMATLQRPMATLRPMAINSLSKHRCNRRYTITSLINPHRSRPPSRHKPSRKLFLASCNNITLSLSSSPILMIPITHNTILLAWLNMIVFPVNYMLSLSHLVSPISPSQGHLAVLLAFLLSRPNARGPIQAERDWEQGLIRRLKMRQLGQRIIVRTREWSSSMRSRGILDPSRARRSITRKRRGGMGTRRTLLCRTFRLSITRGASVGAR